MSVDTGSGKRGVLRDFIKFLSAGAAIMTMVACVGLEMEEPDRSVRAPMEVFYGTDRSRLDEHLPAKFYGEGRGILEHGIAHLSNVGRNNQKLLKTVEPRERNEFLQALRHSVAEARRPELLVFVHGFRRSFDRAVRQIAEFVDRTGFPGVPVVWSWPSTSNPAGYTMDETSIRWAQRDFAQFLDLLLVESGASAVHLVGHSLGGRGLAEVALQHLLAAETDLHRIGEFVLLAPDIDEDIFRRDMAPALIDAGIRVTLYTSANDRALETAFRVHGYRRAGDSSDGPLVVGGVETIDVTAANRSILGHSYFQNSEHVASDLAQLLIERLPARNREGLVREWRNGLQYWRLEVDE